MRDLDRRLREQSIVVLDGAMASELERRGHDLADALWSARLLLDAPEAIAAVHRDYIDAGADIITTASYQATLPGLIARGLDRATAVDVLRNAGTIACEARDARSADVLVAASLGPYGAYLADGSEYCGAYGRSVAELVEFHQERIAIVASGVDLLAFETVPDAREIEAIATILRATSGPSALVSCSLADGDHLADGTPLEEIARTLAGIERIAAIGVNCCAPTFVSAAVRTFARHGDKPVLVYPNAGERWNADAHQWSGAGADAQAILALVPEWIEAGARIVGGCCRTGPELTRGLVAQRRSA
jgi:homocysteine S-methyltransferase